MQAKQFVIESAVPAASATNNRRFNAVITHERRREQQDINAWLEMQDDAEIALLTAELTASRLHEGRSYLRDN